MLKQLGELKKKLFPLKGKQLDDKLQSMYDEALAAAYDGKGKQALDGLTALLDESMKTPDWAYQRVALIIPAIIRLAQTYDPARFKVCSLEKERDKQLREGKGTYQVVQEWCTLVNAIEEPDTRILAMYDELKKKFPTSQTLNHFRKQQSMVLLDGGRYTDYREEDLKVFFEFLENDAADFLEAQEDVVAERAEYGDGEELDEQQQYADDMLRDFERSARLTFELSLGLGNEAYAEKCYKVVVDTRTVAATYLMLIASAERLGNANWVARLMHDAKSRLSGEEFESLCKGRASNANATDAN